MAQGKAIALTATGERQASTMSGYVMLGVLLLAILLDVFGIQRVTGQQDILAITLMVAGTLLFILVMPGFYMLQPNQAVAITLFG